MRVHKTSGFFLLFNLASLIFFSLSSSAQQSETQGWIFITHTQKLNKRFDILADAQVRTANHFEYLNTMLLRGALNYNFNKSTSIAFGYAFKGDREKDNNDYEYTQENRIYEQYIYQFKILRTELMLRGRLEQRWINEEQTKFFQRARAFFSAQFPLFANKAFTKGWYAAAQNEIFLNIQNQEDLNGSIFDQNRTYLSAGYRWTKSIDTEIGYMYWHQEEMKDKFNRHVIQLQVTTNF